MRAYFTRRDWLLVEIVIGIVSIATGISAVAVGGIVSNALNWTGDARAWYYVFVGTGTVMIAVAIIEMVSRHKGGLSQFLLCAFARVRMWSHFFNGLCWLYAFLALLQAKIFMASIFYEAVPILIINMWGVVEHAKALYLDVGRAGTSSLVRASLQRIRG